LGLSGTGSLVSSPKPHSDAFEEVSSSCTRGGVLVLSPEPEKAYIGQAPNVFPWFFLGGLQFFSFDPRPHFFPPIPPHFLMGGGPRLPRFTFRFGPAVPAIDGGIPKLVFLPS